VSMNLSVRQHVAWEKVTAALCVVTLTLVMPNLRAIFASMQRSAGERMLLQPQMVVILPEASTESKAAEIAVGWDAIVDY